MKFENFAGANGFNSSLHLFPNPSATYSRTKIFQKSIDAVYAAFCTCSHRTMRQVTPCYVVMLGIALLWAVTGRGQDANQSAKSTANMLSSLKSTAQVRQLLPVGMTTNELVAKIGPPLSELVLGQPDELWWTYQLRPFPADDDMRGTYVTTLSVWVAKSRVARVSFGYQGGPTKVTKREQVPGRASTNDPVALDFFVVRTNAYSGGRFIDTPHLPKLGHVAAQPDLSVSKLEEVEFQEQVQTDSEGKKITNWVFAITLTREDGRRFAELTSTNSLKKILIAVAKEPIVAPMVAEPIEGGFIHLSVLESQRDYVKTNLAKIRR